MVIPFSMIEGMHLGHHVTHFLLLKHWRGVQQKIGLCWKDPIYSGAFDNEMRSASESYYSQTSNTSISHTSFDVL